MATLKLPPCVCRMCNCGTHHCPAHAPNKRGGVQLSYGSQPSNNFVSTHSLDFKPHGPARQPPCVPVNQRHTNHAHFDDETTNKHDYTPKSTMVTRVRPPQAVHHSTGPLENTSMAHSQFVAHRIEPNPPVKPPKDSSKFGGPTFFTTTNQEELRPFTTPKREPPARPPRGGAGDAIQGTGPVAKSSMYRDEYQPLAVSKREPSKPARSTLALGGDGPWASQSVAQDTYIPHKSSPTQPVHPPKANHPTGGTFFGSTTAGTSYVRFNSTRREPVKPPQGQRPQTGNFDGQTTHHTDFQAWKSAPTKSFKPEQRRSQSVKPFDDRTMHKTEFIERKMTPNPPIRPPQDNIKPMQAENNWMSTYGADMQVWKASRTEPIRHPVTRHGNNAEFEGTTEQRSAFTPKAMSRSQPVKPRASTLSPHKGPFGGQSAAQAAYTPPPPPCPALRLPPGTYVIQPCAHAIHAHTHDGYLGV